MKKRIVYYPRFLKFILLHASRDPIPSLDLTWTKEKYNAFRKKAFTGIKFNVILIQKKVIYIGKDAFLGCEANQIGYEGTEEEWAQIDIEEGNELLDPSIIHFNCDVETLKKGAANDEAPFEER